MFRSHILEGDPKKKKKMQLYAFLSNAHGLAETNIQSKNIQ